MQPDVDPKLAPSHQRRCACGREKTLMFTFCAGCQRVLDLSRLTAAERVRSLEDSLGPKYLRSLEVLRAAGRLQ